jgi:hypothetical protein
MKLLQFRDRNCEYVTLVAVFRINFCEVHFQSLYLSPEVHEFLAPSLEHFRSEWG